MIALAYLHAAYLGFAKSNEYLAEATTSFCFLEVQAHTTFVASEAGEHIEQLHMSGAQHCIHVEHRTKIPRGIELCVACARRFFRVRILQKISKVPLSIKANLGGHVPKDYTNWSAHRVDRSDYLRNLG